MRRTLARTRDTLDAPSLPSVEGTELNHRTKVWTDTEERNYTGRMLGAVTTKVVLVGFFALIITLLMRYGPPVGLLVLLCGFSYVASEWRYEVRRNKMLSNLGFAFLFTLIVLLNNAWTAYLAFGAAVAFTAWLSHVITKQYAFFMTANERLQVRTVRRWQGFWFAFPSLRGPRFLPQISAHTWGFGLLVIPYALGFGALIVAEQSEYAPVAGAVGVTAFIIAVPVVWTLLGDLRIALPTPFRRSIYVCWKALVTWVCYNRHQTPAAGVFRFPTRWTRLPYLRDLAVSISLSLFAIAIFATASNTAILVANGICVRLTDIPLSIVLPDTSPVELLPHEQAFMDKLPEEKKYIFQARVRDRRIEAETEARAKRWSFEYYGGDYWVLKYALSIFICFLAPFASFFAVFWFISGRLLTAFYNALEAPGGHQQSTKKAPWDNRVERLISSRDKLETEHLYMGRSLYGDYPVLLHQNLLQAHAHILGDTGSRKTSIGLAPMLTQLIAREDSSVLILDLKGDKELFQCAMAEADAAGIPFKWFTNVTGRSSYIFNPFAQSHVSSLTINQMTQGILQALSLEFGEGYGASYFSAMNEIVLATYLRKYRDIGSFRDLYRYMKDKNAYRGIGDLDDWEKARHLATLVNKLAEVYPLSLKPSDLSDRSELFQKQIDIPSLLGKRQVIYFFLASSLEPTTVSPVAKLAMFALLTAAARRNDDETNRVYVFLDEFQRIISENVKIFLEQARSMKLHFILANQTAGQLESSGTDLTDTVDSCTAFKQSFKATDLKSLKKLEEASGEALYHSADWSEAIEDGLNEASDDAFDIEHTPLRPLGPFEERTVRVKESVGPRLERNTIIELSAKPMASFVRFTEGSGYTQFSGYYTPMLAEYHISEKTFKARGEAPWPKESRETVIGHADSGDTREPKPFMTGSPGGPPPPENVPDDFDQHLDDRLTGPEVPRPTRSGEPGPPKKGKRPK